MALSTEVVNLQINIQTQQQALMNLNEGLRRLNHQVDLMKQKNQVLLKPMNQYRAAIKDMNAQIVKNYKTGDRRTKAFKDEHNRLVSNVNAVKAKAQANMDEVRSNNRISAEAKKNIEIGKRTAHQMRGELSAKKNKLRVQSQEHKENSRFRMEYLSLLFFGQAVNQMVREYTQAAWDSTGAAAIFGASLTAASLEAMDYWNNMLGLTEASEDFAALAEKYPKTIGSLTLALDTVSAGMAAGGQYYLGVQGMILVYQHLKTALFGATVAQNGLNTAMSGGMIGKIIAAVGGLAIVLKVILVAALLVVIYALSKLYQEFDKLNLAGAELDKLPFAFKLIVIAMKGFQTVVDAMLTPMRILYGIMEQIYDLATGKGLSGEKFLKTSIGPLMKHAGQATSAIASLLGYGETFDNAIKGSQLGFLYKDEEAKAPASNTQNQTSIVNNWSVNNNIRNQGDNSFANEQINREWGNQLRVEGFRVG